MPDTKITDAGYCLTTGRQLLVYLPKGGRVALDLGFAAGRLFQSEWLEPETGRVHRGAGIEGGAIRQLDAPFAGHAVLFLKVE